MTIIKPHLLLSRHVEDDDIDRILDDGEQMLALCNEQHGIHKGAMAIAHSQVTDKDPLRFFCTYDGKLVIDPVIIKHSKYEVEKEEGCVSFPENKPIKVTRWQKCVVKYFLVDLVNDTADEMTQNLSGTEAQVFQHELNHFDAKYIFPVTTEILEYKNELMK